jgi:hypothetical protein
LIINLTDLKKEKTMKFKLILMLGAVSSACFASSVETLVDTSDSPIHSERRIRLVLRNSAQDTSPINLVNSLRQQILDLRIESSTDLVTWVEDNVVTQVRRYLAEQPNVERLLEENARIELSLNGSSTTSDTNPIVMIIDRWTTQTAEDAIVSAILYPASIPMQSDECDYNNIQHLRRLALSASYGNLLAYHHLTLWADLNRPDTHGLPRDRELSYEEILHHEALHRFETLIGDLESSSHNDFQRRTLLLCIRDFRPGTTTRSGSNFGGSENIENEDPRLLFSVGVSEKKPKLSLIESRKAGFVKARFHEARYIKDKRARAQELQRLKRDLTMYQNRSRSLIVGTDLFEKINAEVDESLMQLNNKRTKRTVKTHTNLSSEQISSTSKTILEIINK